jgi:hypothetical protein
VRGGRCIFLLSSFYAGKKDIFFSIYFEHQKSCIYFFWQFIFLYNCRQAGRQGRQGATEEKKKKNPGLEKQVGKGGCSDEAI